MKRLRIIWQLYGAFAALIVITMLVFGFQVMAQFQADTLQESMQSLELKAKLIRKLTLPYLLENRGLPDEELRNLASIIGDRITVINVDGQVLSDSEKNPASMDNHGSRPEILQAKLAGTGISQRFSKTLGKDMQYLALRIDEQDTTRGFVRVSILKTSYNERLFEMRDGIMTSAIGIGLFALMLGFVLARRFTRPLVHMTNVAARMAEGDYDQRLPEISNDEIGELSSAFNQLAASLAERISTMAEDRNQLAAILSGLIEGVIAIDQEQRIIHLNEAAGDILGVRYETVKNRLLWEELRISELIQATDRVLHEEAIVQTQFSQGEVPIELTVVPLKDSLQRISGAIIVMHDLTEIRRLETMRSDFVANASHELKTPITAIRGLVETVIDDPQMPEKDRIGFTNRIKRQTMRLSSIVTDLLTLSRYDSSFAVPEMQLVDFAVIVNAEIAENYQLANDRNIEIQSLLTDEPVMVKGDELALVQMVNNLIDNALKYTAAEGQVIIELEVDSAWILFSVADNGTGISEQEQQRIFERFYRVDKARSTEMGGTGLGLSIVKHIVLAHGGEISVESSLGVGSAFKVRLPLTQTI